MILTPEQEALVEARRICADTIGVTGLVREFYLDGTYDKGDHVRTTLAAYTAGRRAGREEARELLKPFAEAADDLDDKHRDGSPIWEAPAAMGIDAGDLRRAQSFIRNLSEQESGR